MKHPITLEEKVAILENEVKELRNILHQFISTTDEYAQSLDATNAAIDSVMSRIGMQRVNGPRPDCATQPRNISKRDTLEHLTLSSSTVRISSAVSQRYPTASYVNFYTTNTPGVVGMEFANTPISDMASSEILWVGGAMHLKNLATVNTVFRFALAGTNTTCKFWKLDQDPHAANRVFAWPVELSFMFDQKNCEFVAPFQSHQQNARPVTVAITGNERWSIRLQGILPNMGSLAFKTVDIEQLNENQCKFVLHEDLSGKYKAHLKTETASGLLEVHSKAAIKKFGLLPNGQSSAHYTALQTGSNFIVISVNKADNDGAKKQWRKRREEEKAQKKAQEDAQREAEAAAVLEEREAARRAYAANNNEQAEVFDFAAFFS